MQTAQEELESELQLEAESTNRIGRRIVFGIATGIISQLFFGWVCLFILVAIYSFIEAASLFSLIIRTQKLKCALENQEKILTPEDKAEKLGEIHGYAITCSLMQFVLSFLGVLAFAVIAKLITGFF